MTARGGTHTVTGHQSPLVETNVNWLRQALRLLEQIPDGVYSAMPAGFAPHRVGGHLRHILEFYECLLDGLQSGRVDYDARRRDENVEKNPWAAMTRIRGLIDRLESTPLFHDNAILLVRMEDSQDARGSNPFLVSSLGRELQVLSSHTIHHFALIAMTLTAHGISVDRSFGMAPSTLRHAARRSTEAA